VAPGKSRQEALQNILRSAKAIAVVIGPKGLGEEQHLAIERVVDRLIVDKIPVIPLLLPRSKGIEAIPLFLRGLRIVQFVKSVDDAKAFFELEWGITGVQPSSSYFGADHRRAQGRVRSTIAVARKGPRVRAKRSTNHDAGE
jgi:hypothetical protein